MKMVEDRVSTVTPTSFGMVPESLLFSLARGVSPDLRIVLRARLSDSLLLGPLGGVSAIDLIGGISADGDRAPSGASPAQGFGNGVCSGARQRWGSRTACGAVRHNGSRVALIARLAG